MIIDHSKKYVVMLPAKTGSTTLFQLINKQTSNSTSGHPGHKVATHLTEAMKKTYCIYAFYRDPYTRFVSAWQYRIHMYKTKVKHIFMLPMMKIIKQDMSLRLIDITPEFIDTISVAEFLKSKDEFLKHQYPFYTSNTILFSYENYETNVRDLLDRLGLDSSVDIPKLNSTYDQEVYDKITSEEKKMIIDYYKPDYDYFSARGIYFESNKQHK